MRHSMHHPITLSITKLIPPRKKRDSRLSANVRGDVIASYTFMVHFDACRDDVMSTRVISSRCNRTVTPLCCYRASLHREYARGKTFPSGARRSRVSARVRVTSGVLGWMQRHDVVIGILTRRLWVRSLIGCAYIRNRNSRSERTRSFHSDESPSEITACAFLRRI